MDQVTRDIFHNAQAWWIITSYFGRSNNCLDIIIIVMWFSGNLIIHTVQIHLQLIYQGLSTKWRQRPIWLLLCTSHVNRLWCVTMTYTTWPGWSTWLCKNESAVDGYSVPEMISIITMSRQFDYFNRFYHTALSFWVFFKLHGHSL